MSKDENAPALRRGWTTGACAAAAAKAAYQALLTGRFPDPVEITLPGGQRPAFALAREARAAGSFLAAIVKDAGDDPDVTHGALVEARVSRGPPGSGIVFRAGRGVGHVTRPGLPLAVGEPAINPVPRRMIAQAMGEAAGGGPVDATVEIAIENGEALALKTLNPRLGIVGGLSVLGTTGIVVPFSCSAWIDSIRRGIDVARAMGLSHIAGSTGSTSEAAVARLYGLDEVALIEMGDFVGGMLKYLRTHPVPRVTIAGGFAKMTKLGQGLLDLHSRRGEVNLSWLAARAGEGGADASTQAAVAAANTALAALELCAARGVPVAGVVAEAALRTARAALGERDGTVLDVVLFDRGGALLAKAGA